jgi:hypothetical protein
MKIWGASEKEIRQAAAEVGIRLWDDEYGRGPFKDGRALRVRLCIDRLQPRNASGYAPFQRTGHRGRRLPYVCWHGHKRFMLALFRRQPEARIKTALADYHGRADFLLKHKGTFGQGNGFNVAYGQRCTCAQQAARLGNEMENWRVIAARLGSPPG